MTEKEFIEWITNTEFNVCQTVIIGNKPFKPKNSHNAASCSPFEFLVSSENNIHKVYRLGPPDRTSCPDGRELYFESEKIEDCFNDIKKAIKRQNEIYS